MILMADSIRPLTDIPVSFRVQRNRGALLYADGDYACSPAIASVFRRREWISVTGEPRIALKARFLDVERYDAFPADWPAFRTYRDQLCKDGKVQGWPGVYCSIDPGPPYGVQQVIDACQAAGQELPQHWFIAWYVEGILPPSALEVVNQIADLTGVTLDRATIWGCQYSTGTYDQSIVYQNPDWS